MGYFERIYVAADASKYVDVLVRLSTDIGHRIGKHYARHKQGYNWIELQECLEDISPGVIAKCNEINAIHDEALKAALAIPYIESEFNAAQEAGIDACQFISKSISTETLYIAAETHGLCLHYRHFRQGTLLRHIEFCPEESKPFEVNVGAREPWESNWDDYDAWQNAENILSGFNVPRSPRNYFLHRAPPPFWEIDTIVPKTK